MGGEVPHQKKSKYQLRQRQENRFLSHAGLSYGLTVLTVFRVFWDQNETLLVSNNGLSHGLTVLAIFQLF